MNRNKKDRKIIQLDNSGNFIKEWDNQRKCGFSLGINPQTINNALTGKRQYSKFKFMYKKDYEELYGKIKKNVEKEEKPQKEIVRRKEVEYYVNVLVGLANETLIDGAIYNLNGTMLKYIKKDNALMLDDVKMFTKDQMFREVSVELPLLLPSERDFLSNLLKAFKNVKGIVKCQDRRDGYEYIRIQTNSEEDTICLPSFLEGKYYKSLQRNVLYSIEELDL